MAKARQQQTVSSRSGGTAWHARVAGDEHILEVDHLTISATATGRPVVTDVNLDLKAREILALVGESGSGKTTVGLSILATSAADSCTRAARSRSTRRTARSPPR